MRALLLFCLLLAWLPAIGAGAPYPFTVTAERSGAGQNVIASNRGPAPVSVRLTLSVAQNVVVSQPLPVLAVVRPYSDLVLLQVRPADPGRSLRFSSQSAYHPGNFHAQHDPQALYRLPFADGGSFVISQAADGPLTTHTAADSEYAVDFNMPENTPVVAARAGTVIETESANRYGGRDRVLLAMANYVRILHADETIATYAHLAPGGVSVTPGQRVAAGTLIGHSGATGYTSGPHLHFVVQKPVPTAAGFAMRSLPVRFYVGNPPYVFEPRFRQLATADYSTPGAPQPIVNEKRAVQAR
ncbi:M23 family metallopeptidase [Dechloromonas sp. H13]|uniref:M23 family metallopeptidase n=1 Tax=Dechloromonas sp. H13 TaxID=2570193 RepID=UPI001291949A|nr:M23 family metallopeptidase [Dechloromonas sp. H13]